MELVEELIQQILPDSMGVTLLTTYEWTLAHAFFWTSELNKLLKYFIFKKRVFEENKT